jgi:hypothetical protein
MSCLTVRCSLLLVLVLLATGSTEAADRVTKRTHRLRVTLLEVSPTRTSGDPWDTGIGAFARPDLQVTMIRDDRTAIEKAAKLYVEAWNEVAADLRDKKAGAGTLPVATPEAGLQCGAAIAALQHPKLTEARAKFAADTPVANDTFHARLEDSQALAVGIGDKVAIYLNDIDIASHDRMGEYTLEITKELLRDKTIELKFGAARSLVLQLSPAKEAR